MTHSASRKPAVLSDSLLRKLNTYAMAAGAAGVGALCLAQCANAKVIYTPANKTAYRIYDQHIRIPFDVNHDNEVDFSFLASTYSGGTTGWGRLKLQPLRVNGVQGVSNVARLPRGKKVDGLRHFSGELIEKCRWDDGSRSYCRGQWYGRRTTGYLGLKFRIAGKVHYGWARLLVGTDGFQLWSATLTGYAYETIPNKPIITGKTKGPNVVTIPDTSLGHLALGAASRR